MNTVQPVAWMTESRDGSPMLWPTRSEAVCYCNDDEQPTALYTQPTLDCRTCKRYWTFKNQCTSTVICHAGSQYQPSGPVLLFMRLDDAPPVFVGPNVDIEAPLTAPRR